MAPCRHSCVTLTSVSASLSPSPVLQRRRQWLVHRAVGGEGTGCRSRAEADPQQAPEREAWLHSDTTSHGHDEPWTRRAQPDSLQGQLFLTRELRSRGWQPGPTSLSPAPECGGVTPRLPVHGTPTRDRRPSEGPNWSQQPSEAGTSHELRLQDGGATCPEMGWPQEQRAQQVPAHLSVALMALCLPPPMAAGERHPLERDPAGVAPPPRWPLTVNSHGRPTVVGIVVATSLASGYWEHTVHPREPPQWVSAFNFARVWEAGASRQGGDEGWPSVSSWADLWVPVGQQAGVS